MKLAIFACLLAVALPLVAQQSACSLAVALVCLLAERPLVRALAQRLVLVSVPPLAVVLAQQLVPVLVPALALLPLERRRLPMPAGLCARGTHRTGHQLFVICLQHPGLQPAPFAYLGALARHAGFAAGDVDTIGLKGFGQGLVREDFFRVFTINHIFDFGLDGLGGDVCTPFTRPNARSKEIFQRK